jgi:dUTP pyrophosphatase
MKLKMKVLPKGNDINFYRPEFKGGQNYSVCMDLKARIDNGLPLEISPGEVVSIPTGVFVEIPPKYEGQVRPRSGLARDHGFLIVNSPGTIDCDYRGEIVIIATPLKTTQTNAWGRTMSNRPMVINDGDRIAQLAIRRVPDVEIEFVNELTPSDRGEKGFGSTGK